MPRNIGKNDPQKNFTQIIQENIKRNDQLRNITTRI